MKTLKFPHLFFVALMLSVLSSIAFAQQSAVAPPAPRGAALEVTYFKGRILAYQRIGEFTLYGAFQRPADWKPRPGEVPVDAVKISTRLEEGGVIKARVTVQRGMKYETEDFVGEYVVATEGITVLRELSDFGVVPFEIQLVRAPAAVVDPPAVMNKTKSLQVSVEPRQSTIPMFMARVLNNSPKPVASFSYYTSIDASRKLIGAPRNEKGGALIAPGDTFERTFRYAMNTPTVSTGEVPSALPNLVYNVTSVVFMDGTYEGDPFDAAKYLAASGGEKAMYRRFLEMVRSKEFTNSPDEVNTAIQSVNIDTVIADLALKIPTLTAGEKSQLREWVDSGKSRAVRLFRGTKGASNTSLAEVLQKVIESLP